MKIVSAVNAMIANANKISNVCHGNTPNDEVFFVYNEKYKFSVMKAKDDVSVYFYPGGEALESLAAWDDRDWDQSGVSVVRYSAKELGDKEAMESFSELFRVAKERVYGVDDVLDDIISDLQF
ncbi:hypothetical protein [Lysobacter fragariae]